MDKEAKREQWFTAKVRVNESIPTYTGPWAVPCDSSRRLSTQIQIPLKDVFADRHILALIWLVILSRPSSWLRRPPASTMYSGCDRWRVHLGGRGVRRLAGPDLHRRSLDSGGLGRTSRNPGCPTDKSSMSLAGGTAVPTSQGSKTSEAERLPEARQDVTVLVIPRSPEHQDLSYVYSGSVDRFRSACYGRLASQTCRRVSCVHDQRGEVEAHPPLVGRRNPCGARQIR